MKASVDAFYNFDTTLIVPGYDGDNPPWNYAVVPSYGWANDGMISGPVFRTNTSGPLLVFDNTTFPIRLCDDLQITGQFSYMTLRVVGNDGADLNPNPYWGAGILQAYDEETGLSFAFVVVNTAVYVVYARKSSDISAASFAYIVPIASKSNSLLIFSTYQMVFSAKRKTVLFRIDGDDKFLINKVGLRLDSMFTLDGRISGGVEEEIFPGCVRILTGIAQLGTFMDFTTQNVCAGQFPFCDCREDPRDTSSRMQCTYLRKANTTSYTSIMEMVYQNLGISRAFEIEPVCGCGVKPCLPPCPLTESSSHSDSETCQFGCESSSTSYVDPWAYHH